MLRRSRLLFRVLAIAGLVGLALLLERQFHVSSMLDPSRVEESLRAAGPLGPALFVFLMATAVVSPVPTFPLDVLAGRVYGPVLGTSYALAGATLGAMISFQVARWLGRDLIARYLKGHINFCAHCSDRLLTKVVFLARLVPIVSFDAVSYGSGLTKMSLARFALASLAGMAPLTSVYVSFGHLIEVSALTTWIGGLVVVALLFVLPRWIEKRDPLGLSRFLQHRDSAADLDSDEESSRMGAITDAGSRA